MPDDPRTFSRAPGRRPLPAVGPGARQVLDFIARCEGTTGLARRRHGYRSDYDVTFNYGRAEPRGRTERLSRMTVEAVKALQQEMRGSTAVGRYQFARATLHEAGGLCAMHGLSGQELFDADLQDRLARSLLERRGYDAFCRGEITVEEVMDRLACEWASLPDRDGNSHYQFNGKPQPVRATREACRALLEAARRADCDHVAGEA